MTSSIQSTFHVQPLPIAFFRYVELHSTATFHDPKVTSSSLLKNQTHQQQQQQQQISFAGHFTTRIFDKVYSILIV